MTRERKLAVQMWQEIGDRLKYDRSTLVKEVKKSFCREHNLNWKQNCYFCQYTPDCHKCPLGNCGLHSLYDAATRYRIADAAYAIKRILEGYKNDVEKMIKDEKEYYRLAYEEAKEQISNEHPFRCVCGKLCTGLHEMNCIKFRQAVARRRDQIIKQHFKQKRIPEVKHADIQFKI